MFFGNQPEQTRKFFFEAWSKFRRHQPLSSLEEQLVAVIRDHPEYHRILEQPNPVELSFFPELGNANPFLHMGLHLALREQVATNRPEGVAVIFKKLAKRHGPLEAEHCMMEALAEALWQAQRNQAPPDEAAYLKQLKALL